MSKNLFYPKLVNKPFQFKGSYLIPKLVIKKKIYLNVTDVMEWEELALNEKTYNVVRTTPLQNGKPIFQHPMLLITNRSIETAEDAKNVYHAYILRFK